MGKANKPTPFGPGRSRRPAILAWAPVDYGYYAQSYRYTGEGLIEKAHEEQLEDFYVYAIGYVYRHALELALKHANYLLERALAIRAELGQVAPTDQLTDEQVEDEIQALSPHNL